MAKQPWSDLFRSSGSKLLDTSLDFFVPTFVDGIAEVPSEIISDGVAEWSEVVVGFFVDKRLPFKLIKDSLTKLWKLKGVFKMSSDKELFYFSFSDEEDRRSVVESGPVFIAGRLFVIRKWTEEVERMRTRVITMPVWVNLHNLPKTLWTKKGISFVASLIGFPLFSDETTFKKERLEFARVCVEIPSDHQFASSIKLNMGERLVSIGVEYPWKPPCCSICACFGHKTSKCSKAPARVWAAKGTQNGNGDGESSNTNVGDGLEFRLVVGEEEKSSVVGTKEVEREMDLALVIHEELTPTAVGMAKPNSYKSKEIGIHNKFSLLASGKEIDNDELCEQEVNALEDGESNANEVAENAVCCTNCQEEALVSMENLEEANLKASNEDGVNATNSVDVHGPHELVVGDKENDKWTTVESKRSKKKNVSIELSPRAIVFNETESESENPLGRQDHQNGEDTIHFQISDENDRLVTTVFGVKFGRSSSTSIKDSLPKNDWRGRFIDDPDWGTMLRLLGDIRKEAAAAFYEAGIVSIKHIKIHRPEKSLKEKFHLAPWGATNVEG